MTTARAATVAAQLLAAVSSSSCSSNNIACTTDLRFALVVTVRNGTGLAVCNAEVTVRDGSYSAQLNRHSAQPIGTGCTYFGPPERAGIYTVIVHLGALSKTVTNVIVTKDRCHVQTQYLTVTIG